MFKIEERKDPIKWPVTVRIPIDGGKVKKATFTAHLLFLTQNEYNAVFDENPMDGDSALVRRVLVGWGNPEHPERKDECICDAQGNPLEFNETNMEMLINISYFRSSVVTDYVGFMRGQAAAKN